MSFKEIFISAVAILVFTACASMICPISARADVFGTVRGIVHDPQHRPIEGADVLLSARNLDWKRTAKTDADGEFLIDAVPAGEYTVEITRENFHTVRTIIVVNIGNAPVLHFPMNLASVQSSVSVSAQPEATAPDAASPPTDVTREEIARTPGVGNADSLSMVTNFVPGAYMVHDQLHIRGGHQVSWLVDGVPVPNTNIAGNVGTQFHPGDIETLEVQRGGLSADSGDRTYGVLNVVTRSGFERNREADLTINAGSFYRTDDQLSFGDHTDRFAYYVSANGYRTNLGLAAPAANSVHDASNGYGGFGSFIYNDTPSNQLRLVTSIRNDYFQVPVGPDDPAAADLQHERDAFVNVSWVHTVGMGVLLTVSPFYHYNRAAFDGGPNDTPVIATDHRDSQYAGMQSTFELVRGKHNAHFGVYGFAQHDEAFFGVVKSDASVPLVRQQQTLNGNLAAAFAEDQFQPWEWLTLSGGVRLTHFGGSVSENAASPRVGASVRIPHLRWVLRAFYGRYYQAPPLSTLGGPGTIFDLSPDQRFLALHGERDEQREFGVTIPVAGWLFDITNFRTNARNFFDHDVLENSNIFFPLTIASARIHGWEGTIRSPKIRGAAQFHFVYSYQFAQGRGGVTGGLTDFRTPGDDFFFLDHDQRHTLNTGLDVSLPLQIWISPSISFGSGFLNGNGTVQPTHLGSHTEENISIGKFFGEKWSLAATALNLSNSRYLEDKSNTFGGTHFNYPRQLSVQLKYRFHY